MSAFNPSAKEYHKGQMLRFMRVAGLISSDTYRASLKQLDPAVESLLDLYEIL